MSDKDKDVARVTGDQPFTDIPAAGQDPDSLQRLEKTMEASGIGVPVRRDKTAAEMEGRPDDPAARAKTEAENEADRQRAVRVASDKDDADKAASDKAAADKAAADRKAASDKAASDKSTVTGRVSTPKSNG